MFVQVAALLWAKDRRVGSDSCDWIGSVGGSKPPVNSLPVSTLESYYREHLPAYARVDWVPETGSTNADLLADTFAPAWTVRLAGQQTAGRGRMGRPWVSPAGTQVILSVLLRPTIEEMDQLGTIPLAAGLAVLDTVKELAGTGADVQLKWPNDVLLNEKKVCGILAEAAGLPEDPRIVVGLGLNVSLTREQLPVPHATSLALEGIEVAVEEVGVTVLNALRRRLEQWATGGRDLMTDYRGACATVGKPVRVEAATGQLLGTVTGVSNDGRLELEDEQGARHFISAGDVTHLRRTDTTY